MRQQLGLAIVAMFLVVLLMGKAKAKASDENEDQLTKVDLLTKQLILNQDMQDVDSHVQKLSPKYRTNMVKALARFLVNAYELNQPIYKLEGRLEFKTAWAKCRNLCQLVHNMNSRGAIPEKMDRHVWVKLVRAVDYILDSQMLLPEEIVAHLAKAPAIVQKFEMSHSTRSTIKDCQVIRQEGVFAISTPIAGPDGQISKKTPVFHLPIYSVKLSFDDDKQVEFTCDLADMTDLAGKLKALENQWIKFGQARI